MEKFPNELKIIAGRTLGVEKGDFDGLMEIFKTELSVRVSCGLISSDKGKSMEAVMQCNNNNISTPCWGRHVTGFCAFCKGRHSSHCQTVKNVNARRRILMDTGRCFSCLRSGHVAAGCKSNVKYLSCGGKHHVAVCTAKAIAFKRRNKQIIRV